MTDRVKNFLLDKSVISITAAISIIVCAFFGGMAWASVNKSLDEIKKEMRLINASIWSIEEMEKWTRDLRYDNRDKNLVVPSPCSVKYVKKERNIYE